MVVDAVKANDVARLKGSHSGLFSVQLQPPGVGESSPEDQARALAEIVQKVYLGVDVVLSAEEARKLLTEAGLPLPGDLPPGAAPITAPAVPPAA
jgi:hypothetical protein